MGTVGTLLQEVVEEQMEDKAGMGDWWQVEVGTIEVWMQVASVGFARNHLVRTSLWGPLTGWYTHGMESCGRDCIWEEFTHLENGWIDDVHK